MSAAGRARVVPVLSDRRLNRALLERQLLLDRAKQAALDAVEHLVGLQAQAPLAPYVALWSRLDGFRTAELSELLETRGAVRANTMLRTTIHLLSARDALWMRAALQPVAERAFTSSPFARSLAGVDIREVEMAARELLAERPRTTAELAHELGPRWPDLEPSALAYVARFLVPTIQATPRGLWGRTGRPTAALMESWLGMPLPASGTPDELVVRYLAAFGPAGTGDIRTWSWLTGLREVVERLRPRLRTFRDERGRELFDLPDAPLPEADTPAPVRFFPEFDNVFLSHDDRGRIIPNGRRGYLVYPAGNGATTGTFTLDGFLAGGWRIRVDGSTATMVVTSAERIGGADRAAIEAEAWALVRFAADRAERHEVELAFGMA